MNTDIEYLKLFEQDLRDAAGRESSRADDPAATPAATRPGHRWVRVAGVAAAFLVVAGAIGFIAGGPSDRFNLVGQEADGSGGSGDGMAPAAAPSPAPVDDGHRFELFPEAEERAADESAAGSVDYTTGSQGSAPRPQTGPGRQRDLSKIVRDGRIGVVVPDGAFGDTVGEVTFIAERNGGFVLSSSTEQERTGTFVLRIPARRFDRAIGEIRQLGDVRFQRIEGDDVTAEFIDFRTRLRILEQRRSLLRGLLNGASTTDEILRLSSMVEEVQLRIEQIQGQIRFINNQVAEATLRVSITERNAPNTEPRAGVENPNLGSAWDLAVQGSLRIVGAVIVGLGYLIPLTILAAIVWLAVVLARRRREA